MYTKEELQALIMRLYHTNYKKLTQMIRKDFACATVMEDIIQDVFAEAMAHADILMEHEKPDAWIFETARFKMISTKRKLYAHDLNECSDEPLEYHKFDAGYGRIEIQQVFDTVLSEHEQMIFHMYYQGGYSAAEMAKMEGISEGNFKVRMLRLKERVQKAILYDSPDPKQKTRGRMRKEEENRRQEMRNKGVKHAYRN